MATHLTDTRTAALCTGHKRDGTPCRCIAVTGKTKCRLHGGRSLSGAANGNYRHGRYSTSLPAKLAERYQTFRTNPRLLSLTDEIAVHQARLAEQLTQVETGESGTTWQALQQAMAALEAARAQGDAVGMAQHFATMQGLVRQGRQSAGQWEEIRRTSETLCKLVQTETKTLLGLQQLITVQQHMLMLGAVHSAILEAVKAHADVQSGRKILMAVEAEFTRLATVEAK